MLSALTQSFHIYQNARTKYETSAEQGNMERLIESSVFVLMNLPKKILRDTLQHVYRIYENEIYIAAHPVNRWVETMKFLVFFDPIQWNGEIWWVPEENW